MDDVGPGDRLMCHEATPGCTPGSVYVCLEVIPLRSGQRLVRCVNHGMNQMGCCGVRLEGFGYDPHGAHCLRCFRPMRGPPPGLEHLLEVDPTTEMEPA